MFSNSTLEGLDLLLGKLVSRPANAESRVSFSHKKQRGKLKAAVV